MRKRGLRCRPVFVRLSVTFMILYCIQTAELSSILFLDTVASLRYYSFLTQSSSSPILRGAPSVGAQNTRGWEKWRFSTEISVCLGNDTRQANGCLWFRLFVRRKHHEITCTKAPMSRVEFCDYFPALYSYKCTQTVPYETS